MNDLIVTGRAREPIENASLLRTLSMYHPVKILTMRNFAATIISLLLGTASVSAAIAERSPVAGGPLTGKLNFVTSEFPSLPTGKTLKETSQSRHL